MELGKKKSGLRFLGFYTDIRIKKNFYPTPFGR